MLGTYIKSRGTGHHNVNLYLGVLWGSYVEPRVTKFAG